MKTEVINKNNVDIAVINANILIKDLQSALDLIATVGFETGCSRIVINKSTICEEFFDLNKTCWAKYYKNS